MAVRRTKSADDLRKQTDNIYRNVMEQLTSGKMDAKTFSERLDRVRSIERKYISNIQKQKLYKSQTAENWKRANAQKYNRRVYMTGNNG